MRADGALLHPASTSEVSLGSLESSLRQLKGPLARPEFPIGGPFGKEKIWIFDNVRFADLAVTYSPAS